MEIAHKLNFHNIPVFHINYGCGGYLAAMHSIFDYLQLHKNTTVLLCLTDWPSSMVNKYETVVLFSDAVHVSLWSNDVKYKGLEVRNVLYENVLDNPYSLNVTNGMWSMDGGAVSEFVQKVPDLISKEMKIKLENYFIIPHQPNPKLLQTLEDKYKVPFYKEDAEKFGNTTCSAMMIALQRIITKDLLKKPIMLMGFGDTESYGAVILESPKEKPVLAN